MGMLPSPMSEEPRDQSWYRDEAKRLRARAAAIANDDSYLSLAREYDRLCPGKPAAAAKHLSG